uniref:Uncharacterized protein n=1 Tax=Rhizophagus irregularis (strain DAOM 181602 / DAOM 197198 / MUCL 43194) TaxID=747089 RepID=U9US15_RHIID
MDLLKRNYESILKCHVNIIHKLEISNNIKYLFWNNFQEFHRNKKKFIMGYNL